MSLFCCPICGEKLTQQGNALCCARRHSFDFAAQGYVNLLPANRRHSAAPGDDAGMVAARRAFLQQGWYAPFAKALCQMAKDCTANIAAPAVLDAGCGEGYYTGLLAKALGPAAQVAAFDISKNAVRAAAKQYQTVQFAVASAFAIPVANESVDLLVNIFAPLALEEYQRLLRPGGYFIYAVPGPRHLMGLKQVLYDAPYENTVKDTQYTGFRFCRRVPVTGNLQLTGQQQIEALFAMTPYYWRTPPQGAERLRRQNELATEIEFDFLVYQKNT